MVSGGDELSMPESDDVTILEGLTVQLEYLDGTRRAQSHTSKVIKCKYCFSVMNWDIIRINAA